MTDQSHEIALSKASWFHRVLAIDASLLLLAVMSFVTQLGVSVMLPLLPLYAITLGATPIQQGLLTSGFALASALGQLVAGAFLDRWGARRFIRAGIAIYAAANVLIANALDAVFLIVFRTTAGLGSGANLIGTRVYIAQTANPARLAFVNGVLSAASSAGQVGGPAIGGLIAAVSDLRMPFLLVGFTSGLAFIGSLFLRAAPIKPAETSQQMVATSMWNRSVIVLLISQLFFLSAYGGWITTFAPFATQTFGWSTVQVGSTFSLLGLGSVLLGPWLAHLADRFGRRSIALIALVPPAAFSLVPLVSAGEWLVYPVMFLSGAGITAYNAAWFAMLSSASPSARIGRTFGFVNAVSQMGVVIGATMASAIWQLLSVGAALIAAAVPVTFAAVSLLVLPRSGLQLRMRT